MGRISNEIFGLREAGDHPYCRDVPADGSQDARQDGVPKSTFYAWLDRYHAGGLDALEDHRPEPKRVWNRIPDDVREKIVSLALEEPDLSPREVAVAFTDRARSFVSEASVYRLLKARGLVTSPAFIVMKAADKFRQSDDRHQSALADGLHVSEGHRLGMVLSVDGARRLLALHRSLEALHDHERRRCHRYAGARPAGLRPR
jgi:hypothetical protein